MKIVSYLPFSHPYYNEFRSKNNYNKPIDLLERLSFSDDSTVRNYYVYTDKNCTMELRFALESLFEFKFLIKSA